MAEDTPATTKPRKPTGSRLIQTPEGFQALALLRRGASVRQVHRHTGIATNSAVALRRLIPMYEAELSAIDAEYRNQNKLFAWHALNNVTPKKLEKASAGELVRISHECAKAAGLIQSSAPTGSGHLAALNQFFISANQASISQVDKHPPPQDMGSDTTTVISAAVTPQNDEDCTKT